MKTIVTDTDWRGVPCTMRYDSGKPVCIGDREGTARAVTGGRAPHKSGSTGYVRLEQDVCGGSEVYVGCIRARWVPDFEPNHWMVQVRKTPHRNTKPENYPEWEPAWSCDYDHELSWLAAHGWAAVFERNNSNYSVRVVAVE